MKNVPTQSFAILAILAMLTGCAKKDGVEPSTSKSGSFVTEHKQAENKQEIVKLFSKKLGFLNKELDGKNEKLLLEYGYEFFKKEN